MTAFGESGGHGPDAQSSSLVRGGASKKGKNEGGIRKRRTHIVHTINHVLPLTRLRSCDNPAPQGSGAACEDETGFKLKLLILPIVQVLEATGMLSIAKEMGKGARGTVGPTKFYTNALSS